MGGVVTRVFRPLKNWNVENRAQKIISQGKAIAAPSFPSTKKQIDLVNKLEPDYKVNATKKDLQLDNYLKKVYVESNKVSQKNSVSDTDKVLPKSRTCPPEFEFGYYESKEPHPGKISLRQAVKFIGNHTKDPEKYSVNFIASEYKLNPKHVADILEYYKLFAVHGEDSQQGDVMTPLMISTLKSGATIPYTEKKKNVKMEKDERNKVNNSIKQIRQS